MAEQLDIVTATGRFVRSADRRDVHDGGHWHQVFHCLVVRSGTPTRVVLQRRHHTKAAFPGLLDLSATGHLEAGEAPEHGVRELNEELGIDAKADDLTPVGVRLLADDDGEGRNRERVHLFYMTDDRPLEHYAPEPTEVESLVEVGVDELLALVAAGTSPDNARPATGGRVDAIEWRPGERSKATTLGSDDLIKAADGYWTVLLVMAQRFAAGEGPLAI